MSKETNSAEVLLNQNVAPEQFDWDSFESGLDADARKEKSAFIASPVLLG